MIETWLAIAAGGAAGAVLRGGLVRLVSGRGSTGDAGRLTVDPALATLIANGLGCFLLGAWIGHENARVTPPSVWVQSLATIGFCGGLSTFSTLCGDTLRLAKERSTWNAVGYLAATTVLGFAGFGLGVALPW